MSTPISDILLSAAREYMWMLDHDYPQKASLKLVGDKFMLTRDMRQILYRGISDSAHAEKRKIMVGPVQEGDLVLVDAYNVLFTIHNYLLGKPLFISNDGILRDAGEMRGRIHNKPIFNRAVEIMLEVLQSWNGATFHLYLDEPVSFSGRLSIELSKDMMQLGIEGEAWTVPSPDYTLKHERSDAICTSDTAILDHYSGTVVDLPRVALKKSFQAEFPSLELKG
jgi:hypothetical protein